MSDNQIDIKKCKELLHNASEIIKLNEQEWRKSGKYFNVFSALGIERKEVRHSALLAALLDPNGFHGMSDCFLKEFLHRIDYETFPTEEAIVRTEEVIRGGRRLDISIVSKDGKQKIVIENKIDTVDHDNQLSAYLDDLRKHKSYKLIYLTLNGDEPTEKIENIKDNEIIYLSYKNDILQLLENAASAKNMLPHPVLEIIRQYILTVKSITNQGVDRKMNEDLLNEILKNQDNEKVAEAIWNIVQIIQNSKETWERFCLNLDKELFKQHGADWTDFGLEEADTKNAFTVSLSNKLVQIDFNENFHWVFIACSDSSLLEKMRIKLRSQDFECGDVNKSGFAILNPSVYFLGTNYDDKFGVYKALKTEQKKVIEKMIDLVKTINSLL